MLWAREWDFCLRLGCRDRETVPGLTDSFCARQWLEYFQDDVLKMFAMRTLLAQEGRIRDLPRMPDEEVVDEIVELLVSGRCHVHTGPMREVVTESSGQTSGPRSVPFPLSERPPRTPTPLPQRIEDPPTFSSSMDAAAQAAALVAAAADGKPFLSRMREETFGGGRRRVSVMTDEGLSRIEAYLWPRGERRDVWMILDGARDRRIFSMLLACRLNYSCLYSGVLRPALEIAAPYLVLLDHGHRDTQRFIREAWGNSWGVFLKCDESLDRLRRHLRGFLTVRDPAGSKMLFRYYDPRVLRTYLPTCRHDELTTVFGPIERFFVENEDSAELLEFSFDQTRLALVAKALPITSAAPAVRSSGN